MAKRIKCAIDIGSSSVVCAVGEYDDNTKMLEVLGVDTQKCEHGINAGIITDIMEASNAVKKVIDNAKKVADVDIDRVKVAIRGADIKTEFTDDATSLKAPNEFITERDVEEVIRKAIIKLRLSAERKDFYTLPLRFFVDGNTVKNPIGMLGSHLGVELCVMSRSYSQFVNIEQVVHRAGYEVEEIVYGIIPLSREILYQHEMSNGCALVDFGELSCGIAVYVNDTLKECIEIRDCGGDLLTKEMCYHLHLPPEQVEKLKCEYGYASESEIPKGANVTIDLSDYGSRKLTTTSSEITRWLSARLEEMLEEQIKPALEEHYEFIHYYGIVLTGGSSLLRGCDKAFEKVLELPCRIGSLYNINGPDEIIKNPKYFTALATLKHENYLDRMVKKRRSFFGLFKGLFG